MRERFARFVVEFGGPHLGGFLLLAVLPFAIIVLAAILYLAAFGIVVIWNVVQLGMGWLW